MTRILVYLVCIFSMTSMTRSEPISVAAWNVETFHFFGTCKTIVSGRCTERTAAGSSPAVSGLSLRDEFNGIDIFAFSEVVGEEEAEAFAILADQDEQADYQYLFGRSGRDIRVSLIFSAKRFELLESSDLDFASTSGGSRKPLAAKLRSRSNGGEFWIVAVHLTRGTTRTDGTGSGDLRNDAQSAELRQWIEARNEPVITLGDFNYDVNFSTGHERIGFKTFTENGGPIWVRPDVDVDTNWSGQDRDEFPDSILDFVFISQIAKDWKRRSVVYQRPNDFPDSWRTADHRPIVAFFETDPEAELNIDLTQRLPQLIQLPQIGFNRRAAPVSIATIAPSPKVREMTELAEAAEDLEQRGSSEPVAEAPTAEGAAAFVAVEESPRLVPRSRSEAELVLETLAQMISERMAQDRR